VKIKEISILDVWDLLPESEKEMIDPKKIKGRMKADYAIKTILPPKVHKYYAAHCNTIMGFIGICCKNCGCWTDFGHTEDCPVDELTGEFDYKSATEKIKKIIKMNVPPRLTQKHKI